MPSSNSYSVVNHVTADKLVLQANPRRRAVIFQAVDVSPVGIYIEGGTKAVLILSTNYSSFAYNTKDMPYFGAWYLLNYTDAGTGVATLRIVEVSD